MVITTKNPSEMGFARYIVRAGGTPLWGYALEGRYYKDSHMKPTLSATLVGVDGKSYTVNLTDDDIKNINEARERYKENFKER